MHYPINNDLLSKTRSSLSRRENIYWIVGGAGSGKSTICRALSNKYNVPIYDMDAHIYGAYHGRFSQQRHPVNTAWTTAKNGLAWLLNMTWDEFNNFNQAALPEYLDLLAEDLQDTNPEEHLLIDGGISNPALIAQVIPAKQIVCLAAPDRSSVEIWHENDERLMMKDMICQLPNGDEMWRKFLDFDGRITATILQESQENRIIVCTRNAAEEVEVFAQRVACTLGIG